MGHKKYLNPKRNHHYQTGSSVWSSWNPFNPKNVPEATFEKKSDIPIWERLTRKRSGQPMFGQTKHFKSDTGLSIVPEKKNKSVTMAPHGKRNGTSSYRTPRKTPRKASPKPHIFRTISAKAHLKAKAKRTNRIRAADPSGKGVVQGSYSKVIKPSKKTMKLTKGCKPRTWVEYASGYFGAECSRQAVKEILSTTVDEWHEYLEKFLAQGNTSTPPPSLRTTENVCIRSTKATVLFTNGSQTPCELTIYEVNPKLPFFCKDANDTLENMLYYGLEQQAVGEDEGLTSADWNVSPFLPEKVRKAYVSQNRVVVSLMPGETYKYVSYRKHNKIMDWNMFEQNNNNRYIKNLSHTILARVQGTTVTISRLPPSGEPPVPGAIDKVGTSACEVYYVTQLELTMSSAQNMPYQTSLNLSGARLPTAYEEQFINPAVGTADTDGNNFA